MDRRSSDGRQADEKSKKEISKNGAAIKYKKSEGTSREYKRMYRVVKGLPPKNRIQQEGKKIKKSIHSS